MAPPLSPRLHSPALLPSILCSPISLFHITAVETRSALQWARKTIRRQHGSAAERNCQCLPTSPFSFPSPQLYYCLPLTLHLMRTTLSLLIAVMPDGAAWQHKHISITVETSKPLNQRALTSLGILTEGMAYSVRWWGLLKCYCNRSTCKESAIPSQQRPAVLNLAQIWKYVTI